jgi:hypothetical protein
MSSRLLYTSLILWFYSRADQRDSDNTIALWSSSTFPTLEGCEKMWSGEGFQKLNENTNPNVVDYKGLVEAITSGISQLSVGLGINSGNL